MMYPSNRRNVYIQASFAAWGEGRKRLENVLLGVMRGRAPLDAQDCYLLMQAVVDMIGSSGRPAPAGMLELRDEYAALERVRRENAN